MRAALCCLLAPFVLFATPASAEWVKVAETDSMIVYIDPEIIRKDRHLRWVWELQNYKQTRNDGLMSRRVLDEFDCREEKVRFLSMFNHSEAMGAGPALQLGNDPFITTIVARSSAEEIIFNLVCAY